MSQLALFTNNDLQTLRQMAHDHQMNPQNTPSRPPTEHSWSDQEDHQAPEVYIAKPQTSAGIPKLLQTDGTTGTGTDISGSLFDEPGKALCDIAKIVINPDTGDPELLDTGLPVLVHNLAPGDLAQDWIPVMRTKYGVWIANPLGEEIEVVTDYRVDTVNLKLQKKTRTVLVVPVGDESDWIDVHEGTDCPEAGTATGS